MVGHGSRDPEAASEFNRIAAQLGSRIAAKAETGYLKAEPSFDAVMMELLKGRGKKIYLIPFLLLTGGFTRKIEESASHAAAAENQEREIIVCGPVGFDERLMAVLNERAAEPKRIF